MDLAYNHSDYVSISIPFSQHITLKINPVKKKLCRSHNSVTHTVKQILCVGKVFRVQP